MPKRTFIQEARPVLECLLDHLWGDSPEAVPDLSDTALLLPTRNVGRRVREALAIRAAKVGRAILSPAVLTPGSLFPSLRAGESPTSTSELTLVAAQAIRSQSAETLLAAFGQSDTRNLPEHLDLARFFLETRRDLSESLLDYKTVCKSPGVGDRDRWNALARIDQQYRQFLNDCSKEDPDDFAERCAREPKTYFPWSKIVVAATPDLPERVAVFLRQLAQTHPVEILILAADAPAEAFDDAGRPTPSWFGQASIEMDEDFLHVSRDVHEANQRVAERLAHHPEARCAAACGVGQPVTGTALAFELKSQGIPAHDPAGSPFSHSRAGHFFRHFCGVLFGEEISDLMAWMRDPFVAEWVVAAGESMDREDWIREFDEWMENILPNSISDFFATLHAGNTRSRIFPMTAALRQTARRCANLFALLERKELRPLLSRVEAEEGVSEFAESLSRIRSMAEVLFGNESLREVGHWAVDQAMRFPVYSERPSRAIDVLGWLELLWEESPWLQIPDFHDEAIPGALPSHPLPTEGLRETLGMPGRKNRDARDAYIFRSLLHLRKKGGRVDIHSPKKDLEGRVVAPSRLLYFTPEDNLPSRVRHLTREPAPAPPIDPAPPITINPGSHEAVQKWLEGLDRVHVTSFASWIRCPFSFYLERVLGLKSVEPDRLEMTPQLFGTAVHEVLRQMDGSDDEVEWSDQEAVEAAGRALLDRWFYRQFGKNPGLLLELQREGLARRINAALGLRRTARAEGWRPLLIEWNFREEELLTIDGIPLSGQIDLVEERDNELRIVDYKTKDKAEGPREAHLVNLARKLNFTPSQILPLDCDPGMGWANLQLPLYAAALHRKYPDHKIRVAYGALPRAVTESALIEWEDFREELEEEAVQAATRVMEIWRQDGFWPPTRAFERADCFPWAGPEGLKNWLPGELCPVDSLNEENFL